MTSHIPLALSLLGTLASHYPLTSLNSNTTSKPPPPPPPSVAPSAPAKTPSNPSTNSTAGNVSGPIPTTNPSGLPPNPSNTPGTIPPTTNPIALCEVSVLSSIQENRNHTLCRFVKSAQSISTGPRHIHTAARPVQIRRIMAALLQLGPLQHPEIAMYDRFKRSVHAQI